MRFSSTWPTCVLYVVNNYVTALGGQPRGLDSHEPRRRPVPWRTPKTWKKGIWRVNQIRTALSVAIKAAFMSPVTAIFTDLKRYLIFTPKLCKISQCVSILSKLRWLSRPEFKSYTPTRRKKNFLQRRKPAHLPFLPFFNFPLCSCRGMIPCRREARPY